MYGIELVERGLGSKIWHVMALTLEDALIEFIGRITPSPQAINDAITRADYAVGLLQRGFRTGEVYRGGSAFRGTALSGISDADVIVKVDIGSGGEPSSSAVMEAVQQHLSPLHRGTQAREDGQAITLHYNTWPNVDVVPAKLTQGVPLVFLPQPEFYIPDAFGQWMPTYPKKHDEAMRMLSEESRQLILLAKYWNHKHSKYLTSFHIETLVLNETVNKARQSLSRPAPVYRPNEYQGWGWAVLQFFSHTLKAYGVNTDYPDPQISPGIPILFGRSTQHPVPQIGRVDDYLDTAEALPRLLTAFKQARDGWLAEYNGDEATAIAEFRKVFGERFPVYG